MRLTRIAARDFMGFAELDRDLSASRSIVVVGKNGSGKSTLYDVVRYTLFGRGRWAGGRAGGSPDQQVRHGAERLWTCVEFETPDGRLVRVERTKAPGRTASVGLWVDGEDMTEVSGRQHTNAETDDLIEQLIGMPYDMLAAGPWMAQEEASALMKAAAGDRLRMFVRLFDAEWCAPLHDEAKRRLTVAEAERVAATGRVDEIDRIADGQADVESEREALTLRLSTLQDRERLAADQSASVGAKLAAASERQNTIRVLLDRERSLDSTIERSERELSEHALIMSRARDVLDAKPPDAVELAEPPTAEEIESAEEIVAMVGEARTRAATLTSQARSGQQRWIDLEHDRTLLSAVPCGGEGEFAACQFLRRVPEQAAIDAMKATVDDAFAEAEVAQSFVTEHEDWSTMLARMRREAFEHQQAVSNHALAQQRYESAHAAAREAHDRAEAAKKRLLDTITADRAQRDRVIAERASIDVSDIDGLRDEQAQIEQVRQNVRRQIADVQPELRVVEASAAVIAQALADRAGWVERKELATADAETYGVLVKAFHPTGIPTLVVENGVALIEERVNELLAQLPDDFRIELRTQRERRAGGLLDVLDIVVVVKGWETPYEFLSVGQRFRVDLSLRVAISEVLASRHGTRIDTLWLDEPFAALDEEGREAVAGALAVLTADFDLVVVVSHHPEFNESFDTLLHVTQDDAGISRIVADEPAREAVPA